MASLFLSLIGALRFALRTRVDFAIPQDVQLCRPGPLSIIATVGKWTLRVNTWRSTGEPASFARRVPSREGLGTQGSGQGSPTPKRPSIRLWTTVLW
jgi:hypothetical protein